MAERPIAPTGTEATAPDPARRRGPWLRVLLVLLAVTVLLTVLLSVAVLTATDAFSTWWHGVFDQP
jgi:hypothetical protein